MNPMPGHYHRPVRRAVSVETFRHSSDDRLCGRGCLGVMFKFTEERCNRPDGRSMCGYSPLSERKPDL